MSAMTTGQAAMQDKEFARHALIGELVCGEEDGHYVYREASREECKRFILGLVDKWYYHVDQLAASMRAVERVMEEHGFKLPYGEYFAAMEEELARYDDYTYEHEENE